MKRQLVEDLQQRKVGMINALWANSNYDGEKDGEGIRGRVIEQIEEQYNKVIDNVLGGKYEVDDDGPSEFGEYDESNPFFGKMKLPPKIDMTSRESRDEASAFMDGREADQG